MHRFKDFIACAQLLHTEKHNFSSFLYLYDAFRANKLLMPVCRTASAFQRKKIVRVCVVGVDLAAVLRSGDEVGVELREEQALVMKRHCVRVCV